MANEQIIHAAEKAHMHLTAIQCDMLRSAARAKIKKIEKNIVRLRHLSTPFDRCEKEILILQDLITILSGKIFKLTGSSDFRILWDNM